jgi:hypothetical protein
MAASTRCVWIILLGLILAFVPASYAQDGYTYTIVGGTDDPLTYTDHTVDGFIFSDLTFRSNYPDGMEFRATITPPDGVDIDRISLSYTFTISGKRGNPAAVRPGNAPGEWIATLYELRGMTPWHELDAQWVVRTQDGTTIQSETLHAVYYDATREWFRAESEDIVVYWFGVSEDLGRYVIEAMAGNREKYQAGFGIELPYRPVAIIFPHGGLCNEYEGRADVDDTDFGSTGTIIEQTGSTIQRVRTLEPAAIRKDCLWNPPNPDEEFQFNQAASTTVHEVAHLYQNALGLNGPSWWIEGQATFLKRSPNARSMIGCASWRTARRFSQLSGRRAGRWGVHGCRRRLHPPDLRHGIVVYAVAGGYLRRAGDVPADRRRDEAGAYT